MDPSSVVQGSPEWIIARRGVITASRIKDVMATLKGGGESEARAKYKWELISERLSSACTDHYVSPDMVRGTEQEPFARAAYEISQEVIVDQVGLIFHPSIKCSAASPDGLVGSDGAIEIKVPRIHNHLRWLNGGCVPKEHELQCLWVMECCERKWIDFISYCPEMSDGLQLFVRRMERDEDRISQIRSEVVKLNDEIEEIIAELKRKIIIPPKEDPFESLIAMIDQGEIVP